MTWFDTHKTCLDIRKTKCVLFGYYKCSVEEQGFLTKFLGVVIMIMIMGCEAYIKLQGLTWNITLWSRLVFSCRNLLIKQWFCKNEQQIWSLRLIIILTLTHYFLFPMLYLILLQNNANYTWRKIKVASTFHTRALFCLGGSLWFERC